MIVPPALFGHEQAGEVEEVGPGVKSFQKGMRVVAANSAPCGTCFYCKHGQENLCDDLLFNNGAYAEYIRIPRRIVEKNTLVVPNKVTFEEAAMVEPLACVLLGLNESNVHPGDHVVVIGGGPIGLMFIQVAKAKGCRVISVVKRDEQIQIAKRFGADDVIQIPPDPASSQVDMITSIGKLTQNHGADVVIEAVGRPEAWQWSMDMVRKGGTVQFFGGCAAGTKVELDTIRIHYSALRMLATFHHTPKAIREAFALICDGKVRPMDYITAHAPLRELPQVFRHMLERINGTSGDIKTAILPGN
jgi:L-iditol 2-dehydrogenase